MNELQVFNNAEFGEIRTIVIDNEPWFVGKDVAEALGYTDTFGALKKHVDNEDKQNCQNGSFESPRGMTIINESGVYSLVFGSKLPTAKKFKRWVTSEVLPAIRKTGVYSVSKVPPVKNVRDVVKYIEIVRDSAEKNRASAQEMTEIINSVSEQFGIQLPKCFVEPKSLNMNDVMEMIDYVFSCHRGKGYKLPTYEDWIASKTIKTKNLLK